MESTQSDMQAIRSGCGLSRVFKTVLENIRQSTESSVHLLPSFVNGDSNIITPTALDTCVTC